LDLSNTVTLAMDAATSPGESKAGTIAIADTPD
jgi:hypothetical protein